MCHRVLHPFSSHGLPLFLYPVTLMPNISDPCYQECLSYNLRGFLTSPVLLAEDLEWLRYILQGRKCEKKVTGARPEHISD